MADVIRNWGQITSGTEKLLLGDNGDGSYSLGVSETGAGIANVTAPWTKVDNGTYLLKLVDNLDGSYSIGVHS